MFCMLLVELILFIFLSTLPSLKTSNLRLRETVAIRGPFTHVQYGVIESKAFNHAFNDSQSLPQFSPWCGTSYTDVYFQNFAFWRHT